MLGVFTLRAGDDLLLCSAPTFKCGTEPSQYWGPYIAAMPKRWYITEIEEHASEGHAVADLEDHASEGHAVADLTGLERHSGSRVWPRGPQAAVAGTTDDTEPQQQFAVMVPFREQGIDWLGPCPWQTVAVTSCVQHAGVHFIRPPFGDDYHAFFDDAFVAHGTVRRPTVVGRIGAVSSGFVLLQDEIPWKLPVGMDGTPFAHQLLVVEVRFNRKLAGLTAVRLAVVTCATVLRAVDAADWAEEIVKRNPHIVICRCDGPWSRSIAQPAAWLNAGFKRLGCRMARLWSSMSVVVARMRELTDDSSSDSQGDGTYDQLCHELSTAGTRRGPPPICDGVLRAALELPKGQAKPLRNAAVAVFFGASTRSGEAMARRKKKQRQQKRPHTGPRSRSAGHE
jgi:hypothetical protein